LLNNPFIANPVATLTQDQTFILMVQNEFGCRDTDIVHIRVLAGPAIYVPTAFTPNGDGLNDVFRPIPVGIVSLDFFRVFNRYGELVYETREPNKGWDGSFKGLKQNTGNFVWQVKGIDRTGKVIVLKGNVVLIK
jgi:gliding motility-associated-like protein